MAAIRTAGGYQSQGQVDGTEALKAGWTAKALDTVVARDSPRVGRGGVELHEQHGGERLGGDGGRRGDEPGTGDRGDRPVPAVRHEPYGQGKSDHAEGGRQLHA